MDGQKGPREATEPKGEESGRRKRESWDLLLGTCRQHVSNKTRLRHLTYLDAALVMTRSVRLGG